MALTGLGVSTCRRDATRDRLRSDLITALGPVHLDGARFLGFPPPDPSAAVRPFRSSPRLNSIAARLGRERAHRPTPSVLTSAGILELASGRMSAAEGLFLAAAERRGTDPGPLAELGAFYLIRAADRRTGAADLVLALDACESALDANPRLPEASFNQALALERLFLWHEAAAAWERYLLLDSASGWLELGRTHLAAVRTVLRAAAAERREGRRRLVAASMSGDGQALASAVAQRPEVARLFGIEHLLGAWAGAEQGRQTRAGERFLAIARDLGDALAGAGGDLLLHDSVAAIDAAQASAPRQLDLLVRGHSLVEKGLDLERAEAYLEAGRQFGEALALLDQAKTPFALVASLHLGVCRYYAARYQEALGELTAARERPGSGRYPAIVGYSLWMTGVIHLVRAELPLALADHQAACERFRALHEAPHVAYVESMIAGDLVRLGDAETAWRYRLDALSGLPRLADPRRVYSVLWAAADSALRDGRPAAARRFASELVESLDATASPGVLAEALSRRALVGSRLGHLDAAVADIESGRGQLARVADPPHRRRLVADLDIAEAQVRRASDPARAITLLNRAIGFYAGAGYAIDAASALRERAAAFRATGDLVNARRDLEAALANYETTRATLASEAARIAYFEQAQGASEDLVRLEHDGFHDEARAFVAADQARSRSLLDRLMPAVGSRGSAPAPAGWRGLPRGLHAGTKIVEYTVLAEKTLAWVVGSGRVDVVEMPVGSRALTVKVAAARRDLASASPDLAACRDLHAVLIAPLEPLLSQVDTLAIVPDGPLADLPFSALLDARRRRFLVQVLAVEVAPSAAVYLHSVAAERRFTGPPRSVLAVAANVFDRAAYGDLAPLRSAASEVKVLARIYPQATVLRGTAATRAGVLASLATSELVHLSGHSVIDPGRRGGPAILLAPPGRLERNEAGGHSDLLRAGDVAGRRLPNTRLVVLAACGTATGPKAAEEGSLSLARGFLAAGVPAVIASLWNVEDEQAAVFLAAVHRHLGAGLRPLAALRRAQLDCLARDPGASPATWAAFQLIGGAYDGARIRWGPAGP